MRWLKELFVPSCKCERLGHRCRTEWRAGYVERIEGNIWNNSYVAFFVRQERVVCTRCKFEVKPWTVVKHEGLSGFGTSRENWEQTQNGGYWTEWGHKPFLKESAS
ncbi:hypothetical protein HOU02_gp221 [Caulobacter phage CcrBL9]|uniref:Uncharacterized protein n=1 Tax=Caulobacter phage CcrBL9 TaxID=2283270 RepID=A0A385EC92_9CAUD|nr:hypothetical protein HOU02_gp221 [Caulobacter phage CcrBL9]AXQ69504.1 hypothetical protein CcrBL9_gp480 [Caulobacter phage CcrBL9]